MGRGTERGWAMVILQKGRFPGQNGILRPSTRVVGDGSLRRPRRAKSILSRPKPSGLGSWYPTGARWAFLITDGAYRESRRGDGLQQPNWETFRAVAEVGSISGAARVLNLSQSAVSQKIQQLEDQYGTSLLVRSTQGVRLTAAGEVLYRYVVKLLHTLDEAHDRVRALADERPGPIKVGASLTIAEYILPGLLTRFYGAELQGRLTVMMANSSAVLDLVASHAVDVGLVEHEIQRSDIVRRRFLRDVPTLLVHAGHRWAGRTRVSLDEFVHEPLILREPGSGTRAALEAALADVGLGVDDLTISLVLGTTQAIKAMVRAGLGSSVLSPLTVLPGERGDFWSVEVEELDFARSFYAVHLPLPLSDGARHLISWLTRAGVPAH